MEGARRTCMYIFLGTYDGEVGRARMSIFSSRPRYILDTWIFIIFRRAFPFSQPCEGVGGGGGGVVL